jgi:nucleoside-diphosphate-sugar epimerase
VTESALTVAVTGPTGTFGAGLMPLLQREERVSRVVGIARRPFDPAERGWTKLTYRRGDVRELDALREAFLDADVVVHLAFLITGSGSPDTTRAINVGGTLNAFRAARDAGARRFVYASSVAAYGFHPDNPVGMREDWPVRASAQLFYAREKAELEQLLRTEAEQYPELAVYLLRPSIVLGPHAVGGKDLIPGWLAPAARRALGQLARLPIPLPMPAPRMPLQFVHERDVGQALCRCVLGDGPPAPTTSPATASSPSRTWRASSAAGRCPCRVPRYAPWPGHWPGCRSCPSGPAGWRRPATRRSWTPPGPSGTWVGDPTTRASRHSATPCAFSRTPAPKRAASGPQVLPSPAGASDWCWT